MATCKRPAAVDRPGATTCRKRRRVVGTTADYDTESRLGEGMYGVVVKARHRATGQAVAIKSLCNPFNEHEPADARELLREARFLEGRMHGCHVVHRDLKPANIIVVGEEEGGILKICDFGVALSLSEAPPYENAGTGW
ncbi:hypothetical protein ACQ4PT_050797 [Festuca glaucescens]